MHGLGVLRDIARKGGADADPIPDAGLPQPPADPADGSGPAAPPPGPATPPPPAQASPAGPPPSGGAAAGGPPLVVLREGHKMTFGEQTRAVAGVTWRQARRNLREMRHKEGGLIRHLFSVQPPSVDDQIAYKREKRWVPPGHDDGIADVSGTTYQELIGIPGVAFFGACAGIIARPLRAAIAFFPVYAITCLLLIIFGEPVAGIGMLAGLAMTVIVALIGFEARATARRRANQPDDDEDDDEDDDPADYEPPSE